MNYPTDSEMFTVACLVNTPAWLIPEQAKKATQDLFTDDRAAIVIGALIHLSHEENQPDDEPIRFQVPLSMSCRSWNSQPSASSLVLNVLPAL